MNSNPRQLPVTSDPALECYADEVAWLESQLEGIRPRDVTAFYGSSSIRLWESLHDDFPGVRLVNLGFGGSTLEACAHYFERLVGRVKPKAIVLYAGDNDLASGHRPERVVASFARLVEQLDREHAEIPFTFISIKPSPARWVLRSWIREANAKIADITAARSRSYYVDVYEPMLTAEGKPRPELYVEDGLHLSPAGYQLWTEILLRQPNPIF